jgi:hypothetical protein
MIELQQGVRRAGCPPGALKQDIKVVLYLTISENAQERPVQHV